jgi:uncharacterized membrane protein YvlD (DUF360 family)
VLNYFLGWFIKGLLIVPAILTLGVLFLFVPFLVNTLLLWLTDKLIGAFRIDTTGALLGSALLITLVNFAFHVAMHAHRFGLHHASPTRWI